MTTKTPMDVIRMALDREKDAVRIYGDFAATAKDKKIRDLFLFLVEEEKRHVALITAEIEKETLQEN